MKTARHRGGLSEAAGSNNNQPSAKKRHQVSSRVKPVPDFSRLHQQWESKFQKGKACTKRPCTVSQVGSKIEPRPRVPKQQVDPEEEFNNAVPELEPTQEAFMQQMGRGSLYQTPRQSSAVERQAIYSDYVRHIVSRLTLDTKKQKEATPTRDTQNLPAGAKSPFVGVVGVPQRQSIYRRYVHTGRQLPPPTPEGAPNPHTKSTTKARGANTETKARRIPLKSPAKSPAVRTPRCEQMPGSIRSQRALRVLQHGTTPAGRTQGAGDREEVAGLKWEDMLKPLRITTTPKKRDDLATKLFTDDLGDNEEESPTARHEQLKTLEQLESDLEQEIHLQQQLKLAKYGTKAPAICQDGDHTPMKGEEGSAQKRRNGTPKRQRRSSEGGDKENVSPSKRSRALRDMNKPRGSPLQCISPNLMHTSSKYSANSPKLEQSPLSGKGSTGRRPLRPFEGASPRQAWAVAVDDKENMSPLLGLSPKLATPSSPGLQNYTMDDLNQSLCESLLEMETLETEAAALRSHRHGGVVDTTAEANILRQLEAIQKKQEGLARMQQQLMVQLKLQKPRSGSSGKKSWKKKPSGLSMDRSPLVEKVDTAKCVSKVSESKLSGVSQQDREVGCDKAMKNEELTSPQTGEEKSESPIIISAFSPPATKLPEPCESGGMCDTAVSPPVTPKAPCSPVTPRATNPRVAPCSTVTPRAPCSPVTPRASNPAVLSSPKPVMCGSAQLMGPRPRYGFSPVTPSTPQSPFRPPMHTPLALRTAADLAKSLVDSYTGSPGEASMSDSHTSPASAEVSSLVSSPELSLSGILKISPDVEVQRPLPSVVPRCYSPVKTKIPPSPGSLSLAASLGHHVSSPFTSHGLLHSRKHCSVAQVADRYRDALLDQEVALYTGRVGMKLRNECVDVGVRCIDPVARMLVDGDNMHFVPIQCPITERGCAPMAGSAFSHCTIRNV